MSVCKIVKLFKRIKYVNNYVEKLVIFKLLIYFHKKSS